MRMDEHKREFIEYLLSTGALKVGGDYSLKSGRLSPYFVNIADFNDGESTQRLALAYANALLSQAHSFDLLYGIPEKGVALAPAVSVELARQGANKGWFFTRKDPKTHGEASVLPEADKIKKLVVGRAPKPGQRIVQLDDVFTAGDAKYEARSELESLGDFEYPLLVIAVDRQEVGIDGTSAIERYSSDKGTKVLAVVTAAEIYDYLKDREDIPSDARERMATYLRVYGTDAVRWLVGKELEQRIISQDRSVIPACDVESLEEFERLVQATADQDGIGGYKIGFDLGLGFGLPKVAEVARRHTNKPLIYDHQKAGTDIPATGKNFSRRCKAAGIDAVILFPQAGPETERAWIYHAQDAGLNVIVGGRMTHAAYARSEGGFITDEGALDMYRIAARAGINHFVVPGNKPQIISLIKTIVEAEGVDPVFYAPGFVAQGGKIAEAAAVAGRRWHALVGTGIHAAQDIRQAAREYTSQLAPTEVSK